MNVRLTQLELTDATLEQRMQLTRQGQVTWAQPSLGKLCTDCTYFARDKPGKPDGICRMVKVMTKKKGKPFDGSQAWACGKYEPRQEGLPQ